MPWKFPEYPPDWKERARQILERDGYRCRDCGRKDLKLDVHHIISPLKGGSHHPSNLITLCEYCHAKRHPHMEKAAEIRMRQYIKEKKPRLHTEYEHLFDDINARFSNEEKEESKKYSQMLFHLTSARRRLKTGLIFYRFAGLLFKKWGNEKIEESLKRINNIEESIQNEAVAYKKKLQKLKRVLGNEKQLRKTEFTKKLKEKESTYLCKNCNTEMEFSSYKIYNYKIVICPYCENEEVVPL